jgi:hypothetical protein
MADSSLIYYFYKPKLMATIKRVIQGAILTISLYYMERMHAGSGEKK